MEEYFQITIAVFQSIVENVAEHPSKGFPVELAVDPVFGDVDLRLNAAVGEGAIESGNAFLQNTVYMDGFHCHFLSGKNHGIAEQLLRQLFHGIHPVFNQR